MTELGSTIVEIDGADDLLVVGDCAACRVGDFDQSALVAHQSVQRYTTLTIAHIHASGARPRTRLTL